MIKIFRRALKDKNLIEVNQISKGCWINIVNPSEEELVQIREKFKLDKEKLMDGLDENELPSIEKQDGNVYIVIRTPFKEAGEIISRPLMIIITDENIFTISRFESEVLDKIIKKEKVYTTQKTNFLLSLFQETTNLVDYYIKQVTKTVKSKKYNLQKLGNDDILGLVNAEESVNEFISSFYPLRNVLKKVLSGRFIRLYEKDKDVIEDLVDDSEQTLGLCDVTLKTITNIREAYSTILTNNLNKVIKFLTAITIILTVPTIISGMYGMNVSLPMGSLAMAFWYIMAITFVICLLIWLVFARRKWM